MMRFSWGCINRGLKFPLASIGMLESTDLCKDSIFIVTKAYSCELCCTEQQKACARNGALDYGGTVWTYRGNGMPKP